ncbi:MAG: transcription-repair coupling factor [Anaerolineae bacterium]|nr:transcription-repair coupling factor [Anaerolineae bacterium]
MLLSGLTARLRQSQRYQDLQAQLQAGSVTQPLLRAARPFVLATLAQDWPAPLLYITGRGKRAHNVAEQLPVWLDDGRPVLRLAEPTPMFYDRLPWDKSVIQSRLEVLAALTQPGQPAPIIIASARALMQITLPPALFAAHTQRLRPGQRHDLQQLLGRALAAGYEPASIVSAPGQFSRRGGILDIFPPHSPAPVRVEFFGDEIDTLRHFDPATQRSSAAVAELRLIPAREALPGHTAALAQQLAPWFAHLRGGDDAPGSLAADGAALAAGTAFPALEYYLPCLYDAPATALDYAPPDALILLDDADDLRDVMQEISDDAATSRHNNAQTGQLPPAYPAPFVGLAALHAALAARRVLTLNAPGMSLSAPDDDAPAADTAPRWFVPERRFGGQLRPVLSHARDCRSRGEAVVIVSGQVERLADVWAQEAGGYLPRLATLTDAPPAGLLAVLEGSLSEGWTLDTGRERLHLLTDAGLFNWSRPEPRRRPAPRAGRSKAADTGYGDWQPGDFVVHVDFGIGRFRGLQARTVEGSAREYLVIEYEGTDTLFVPIHQADRLTRYVGADDTPPRVNKLGKPQDWLKTRDKARKAAEEEAKELLAIYAKRAASPGHAFQPDTPWQHELEAAFPYVETDDQIRAIREIKHDMEQAAPMDRLVCGDVGYGKTEVALRAAFKAVMDGRQVAVLVPTTVLADQHYNTFKRRMSAFPVRVELISRFRTRAEQTAVLQELAGGQIDIIVGTHRLLSADVQLKNPGLVIIDEEQRFGVKHKEHFKRLRASVDMLTLTATPIPRTLYMTLSGVRDISMIQTPPEDRLPVITHVSTFDPRLARQAILRELERGGQVFIIHNRVRTIDQVRERFEAIVPEASIVVAHGQMPGRMLESIISDFGQGKYDILLATSIIENGIDMPNVNTLIVDRADFFGIAQLYQIRGRVGRGAQQAYCYFFHAGKLTEEARTRLETLAEHSDLGAGFQIAVRDLELRGAGDILSTRQTGYIATVGLQLYTQLLQQAVQALKHEATPAGVDALPAYPREQVVIDLPVAAYIPGDWIAEMSLRLHLYRRIGSLQTPAELDALAEELRDRFGALPTAVDGLLYQIRVKLLANSIRATAVQQPRQHILIKLPWLAAVNRTALAARLGSDVEVSRTAVELRPEPATWRRRLLEVMAAIRAGLPEGGSGT